MNTSIHQSQQASPMSEAAFWGEPDEQAQQMRKAQYYECSAQAFIGPTSHTRVSQILEVNAAAVAHGGDVQELSSGYGRISLGRAELGFRVHTDAALSKPKVQITPSATGRPTRWSSVLVRRTCGASAAQANRLERAWQ